MRRAPLLLLAGLAATPGTALGQSLDYARSIALFDSVLTRVRGLSAWAASVRPLDLHLTYDEGQNIEFWLDAVERDAAQLDTMGAEFRAQPRLTTLVDVVLAVRRVDVAVLNLGAALSDCHTCDAPSKARSGGWARSSRDLIRALAKARNELDAEMHGLLNRAETLLEARESRPAGSRSFGSAAAPAAKP